MSDIQRWHMSYEVQWAEMLNRPDVWHDGHAVTHTETTTDAGPNCCRECSEARGHWVRWPCPATSERSE